MSTSRGGFPFFTPPARVPRPRQPGVPIEPAEEQIIRYLREIRDALTVFEWPLAVDPLVKSFDAADAPEILLPANPQRVKLHVYYFGGTGTARMATLRQARAGLGIPVTAAVPFLDVWPIVHRGEWWAQVSNVDTQLLVVEWTLQP